MLKKLAIKNFVLIKDIDIDFSNNLNVITGETGAGKSLILKAINLITGKRISGELVRNNCTQASLIGVFSNPGNLNIIDDFEIDDEIIIRKIIKNNGVSKTYLNDIPVTSSLVQKLTNQLIEIHGQSEQQHLTSSDKQLNYLDSLLDAEDLINDVKEKYQECKIIRDELNKIAEIKNNSGYEYNYLLQIKEDLEKLQPSAGEYQRIDESFFLLKERGKNNKKIQEILNIFNNELGILDLVNKAQNNFLTLPQEIASNESLSEDFRKLVEQSDIISEKMQNMHKELNNNNDDFAEISEKISEYKRLARKFQRQPEDLHELYTEITNKINYLENLDQNQLRLEQELNIKNQDYLQKAKILSNKRQAKIPFLTKEIESQLHDLNMPSAKFVIEHEQLTQANYGIKGIDKINFLIAANLGQQAKELARAASGGELSRIMLSLKIVQKNSKNHACLIFDEIDTGIGGNTAEKLGLKLQELGKTTQIILVTHQALIANKARSHLLLQKIETTNETITTLKLLNKKEQELELNRMLFGTKNKIA